MPRLAFLLAAVLLAALPMPSVAQVPITGTVSYTGSGFLHDWTGTSDQLTGEIAYDAAQPEQTAIRVEVPVASFDSGNARRDRGMHEATEADEFPTVSFVSQAVSAEPWAGEAGSRTADWIVTGKLTFHGITRDAQARVEVTEEEGSVRFDGQFRVSLEAFEVDRPGYGPTRIGDQIRLRFEVVMPVP
ncbi:MAG: YceI family protein [Bacteroidota bacterium]